MRWMWSLIFVFGFTAIASACPMCKDSIPATDATNYQAMPAAYNWSVYFFLGGLFAVMGFVITFIVKQVK